MPYQDYDFVIKKGDTGPPIQVQCIDSNGTPVDLTGATGLKFRMRNKRTGVSKINGDGIFVERSTGKIQYNWVTADTDTSDEFEAEFNMTLSNGQITSFPNNTYIRINIYESTL